MVSGFFTSPYDHERIFSGDARPILIASNSSSCVTCLNRSSNAFIETPWFSDERWALGVNPGASGVVQLRSTPDAERSTSIPIHIHVYRQRADFLHQHVERFR